MQGLGRDPAGYGGGGGHAYGGYSTSSAGGGGNGLYGNQPGARPLHPQATVGPGQAIYSDNPYDDQVVYVPQAHTSRGGAGVSSRQGGDSYLGRGGSMVMSDSSRVGETYGLDSIRQVAQQQLQQQQQRPGSLTYAGDYSSALGYMPEYRQRPSLVPPTSTVQPSLSYLSQAAAASNYGLSPTPRSGTPGLYELGALAGREGLPYGARYASPSLPGDPPQLTTHAPRGGWMDTSQPLPSTITMTRGTLLPSSSAMGGLGVHSPKMTPSPHLQQLATPLPSRPMPAVPKRDLRDSLLEQAIAYGSGTLIGGLGMTPQQQQQQQQQQQLLLQAALRDQPRNLAGMDTSHPLLHDPNFKEKCLLELRQDAIRAMGVADSFQLLDETIRHWDVDIRRTESGIPHTCYIDQSGRLHLSKATASDALLQHIARSLSLGGSGAAGGGSRAATPLGGRPEVAGGSSELAVAPSPPPAPRPSSHREVADSLPVSGPQEAYFLQARNHLQGVVRQLPIKVGAVTVMNFGKIDYVRPAYHCETEIWPIGFRSIRLEYSEILKQVVCLTFDITEGGEKGPTFKISLEFSKGLKDEGGKEKVTFSGRRPIKPWKDAFDKICKAEKECLEERAIRRRRRSMMEKTVNGDVSKSYDPEEQMLRKKIGRLYGEKMDLQCAILKERMTIAAGLKAIEASSEPSSYVERMSLGSLSDDGEDNVAGDAVDRRTFFTRRIAALIEGLPGAERCSVYRSLEERCPRIEAEVELQSSGEKPRSDEKKQEDAKRRVEEAERKRKREEAKGHFLMMKAKEKEDKKRAKEAERSERKVRIAEERKRREEKKDMVKELRRLCARVDAEVNRHRFAVRNFLLAHVDQEAIDIKLSGRGTLLTDEATLPGYDEPLPMPGKRRRLGEGGRMLQPDKMAAVLQIWDFLYTFGPKLNMHEVPSLSMLIRAFEVADLTATRPPTAKERRRLDLLGDLALKLVSILLPDLVHTLMPLNEQHIDRVPLNRLTWPDLARYYFITTGFKYLELIGDPGIALRGRGVNYQLDLVDRRMLALARLRFVRPRPIAALESAGALTCSIALPSPTVLQPLSWQACVEALRLMPLSATDLITKELDRAVKGLEAARVDSPSLKEGMSDARTLVASGTEADVRKAVALALAALEGYQNQLRAMGVQRVKEGGTVKGGADAFKETQGDMEEMDDSGEEQYDLDDLNGPGPPPVVSKNQSSASAADSDVFEGAKAASASDSDVGEGGGGSGKVEGGGDRALATSPAPRPVPLSSTPSSSSQQGGPVTPSQQQPRPSRPSGPARAEESEEEDDEDEEEDEDEDGRIVKPHEFDHASEMVQRCHRVVRALMASKQAINFIRKPSREALPDYYDVILRPIAFHDILRNLANGMYDDSVGRFAADVRLIFANCAAFNLELEPILMDAERLAARFECLLLSWVLDPEAPPVESLHAGDHCLICREPPPPSAAEGGGAPAANEEHMLMQCERCDASYHPECLGLLLPEQGDWFCEGCVNEKTVKDVDPFMRLRLVKPFPGRGCFVGHVTDVSYTPTGAVYTMTFQEGRVRFSDRMTRQELADLVATYGIEEENPELARHLYRRPPEIDAKAEYESLGHAGWGLGTLLEGEKSLPRRLDPALSLYVKKRAMEDVDLVDLQRAIKALDVDRKNAEDWLVCLSALSVHVGGLPELRSYIEEKEKVVGEVLGHVFDHDPAKAVLPPSLQPGVGNEVTLQQDHVEEEAEEAEGQAEEKEEGEEEEELVIEEEELEAGGGEERGAEETDRAEKETESASTLTGDAVVNDSSGAGQPRGGSSEMAVVAAAPSYVQKEKAPEAMMTDAYNMMSQLPGELMAFIGLQSSRGAEALEALRAIRSTAERNLLSQVYKSEARRALGKKGEKLTRNLGAAEEDDEDDEEDDDEEDEEEDEHEMLTDQQTRPVCAYCKEEDRFVCHIMVHGPNLEECRSLTYKATRLPTATMLLAGDLGCPPTGVLWRPVDPEVAAQEQQLYGSLGVTVHQGSLVAHETCAETIIQARAVAALRADIKDRTAAIETVAYMGRGRTCALGRDRKRRLYWQFAAEPNLLFVQPFDEQGQPECLGVPGRTSKEEDMWVVYETDEDIAKVIAYLHPQGLYESLLRVTLERQYPKAAELLRSKEEQHKAMTQQGQEEEEGNTSMDVADQEEASGGEEAAVFVVGDEVLVRGQGGLLWNGKVVCVVPAEEGAEKSSALYRVCIEGWERGGTWIRGDQRDEEGRLLLLNKTEEAEDSRDEAWSDYGAREEQKYVMPRCVESLMAYRYLGKNSRNRVRFRSDARPKFEMIRDGSECLYELKCALLTLEAALPVGCMYDEPEERTRAVKLRRDELPAWVRKVEAATTANELMQALVLLEYSIDPMWRKRSHRDTYVGFVPSWALALKHATLHSVALRIWSLDQLLDYERTEVVTSWEGRKLKAANKYKAMMTTTEDYLTHDKKVPTSYSRKRSSEVHPSSSSASPDMFVGTSPQAYGSGKKYKRYS